MVTDRSHDRAPADPELPRYRGHRVPIPTHPPTCRPRARWISQARGAMAADVSDQVTTPHCSCPQRPTRLTQISVTG